MSNAFMGQYLLEMQLLTQEQLDKALLIQQASNIRLGQLSIDQGFLNIDQVLFINQQQRLFNKKFGDIAVDQNLLSLQQIEQLLALQKNQRKMLGEILLEEGFISEASLREVLLAQRKHQEGLSQSINALNMVDSEGRAVKEILSSNEKLFLRCLNSRFKVTCIAHEYPAAVDWEYIVGLTITHKDNALRIAMVVDQKMMLEICSRFMGLDRNECDIDLAKDAAGEFLNCIAGYIITDVMSSDSMPTPSPPYFCMNIDEFIGGHDCPVIAEFDSDVGAGAIIIV